VIIETAYLVDRRKRRVPDASYQLVLFEGCAGEHTEAGCNVNLRRRRRRRRKTWE
jgi:hypothetical protein